MKTDAKTIDVSAVGTGLLQPERPINILAVEDDDLGMALLKSQIAELGHMTFAADNGVNALKILAEKKTQIDVVLMDREMPVMDGLTAVRRMKEHPELRGIPVVMVTGASSVKDMKEGLDAGVFYYLTKPVSEEMLRSVLAAAVKEAKQSKILAEELSRHKTSFDLINTCKFKFRTLSEAESLAAFMANCFPDPVRILPGLGELLINAVEHGNLGIGYDKKTELIGAGIWRAEIERLQRSDQYKDRVAEATIARKESGVYVVITDQGAGFEWHKYLKIDPARAGDNHGRGIAQARATSFDKLTYNETGNQVVAFVNNERHVEW